MKTFLALILTAAFAMPTMATESAKPETKKVCVTTTDAKTKKDIEKCKVVKIHKKHEGTAVPEKAPAKPAKPAAKQEPAKK
jgi:hypothetical protein